MDRLTTRNIAGVAVYKNPFECERCGETIWRLPDYGNGSPTEKLAAYEDAEEQGQYGKWIPVSERLPEKSGSYLTWVRYDNEEFMSIEDIDCEGILKEWNFTGKVLYWMPLMKQLSFQQMIAICIQKVGV